MFFSGARDTVTFHLMFVHMILSSVWVVEWLLFRTERLTQLSGCILTHSICNFSYFPF